MQKIARITVAILLLAITAVWFVQSDSTARSATPLKASKDAKLAELTLKEFDTAIKLETRPTLLFFYASWCPHCRHQMPDMLKMEERRKADVRVMYVSIDENPAALAKFLSEAHADETFERFIIAPGEGPKFARYLQSRNSNFRGGVPYSGVFQPNTRLTHEFRGRAPVSAIEEAF